MGLCLARNISSMGMMGNFFGECVAGTFVRVHFSDALSTTGVVAWSDESNIGIKFDSEIEVSAILASFSESCHEGRVNRALRLKLAVEGYVVNDARVVQVETRDISLKGIKLWSPYLQVGDEVTVHLGGLEARKAQVKWTMSGVAGLSFLSPLSLEELGNWASEQRRGPALKSSVESDPLTGASY